MDIFFVVLRSAICSNFIEVFLGVEIVSIIKVIEKIEISAHSAECVIIDRDTLSRLNNTEVNLLLRYTPDRMTGSTAEKYSASDTPRCATHLNETLRIPINLIGARTVAVYLFYDGIPISAGPGEQSGKFISECGIVKC